MKNIRCAMLTFGVGSCWIPDSRHRNHSRRHREERHDWVRRAAFSHESAHSFMMQEKGDLPAWWISLWSW